MDMAAYGRLDGKTAQLTDAARQNLLNLLIAEAAGENVTASARARLEIVLRSIGADSTALYPANSAARVDNAAALAQSDFSSVDAYTAPYVLLAALQGNVKLTDKQVTALISALTGKTVRGDICMTGEITLRGRVLPVGGIKEKVLAGVARGIGHVILPAKNQKDLEEIPQELRRKIVVHTVDSIDDVLPLVFEKK